MSEFNKPQDVLIAGGRFQTGKDKERSFAVKGISGDVYMVTMGWTKEARAVASEAFAKSSGNRELLGESVTAFVIESGIVDPGAARKVAESITWLVLRWFDNVDPVGPPRLNRAFVASAFWLQHRAYVRQLHQEARSA